jgi:hypothetical protein
MTSPFPSEWLRFLTRTKYLRENVEPLVFGAAAVRHPTDCTAGTLPIDFQADRYPARTPDAGAIAEKHRGGRRHKVTYLERLFSPIQRINDWPTKPCALASASTCSMVAITSLTD